MAVVFNLDLRNQTQLMLHRASISVLTKYMLDGSLQSKTNTIEDTQDEEKLQKEYLGDLFPIIDNAGFDDDKFTTIIKDFIKEAFDESRLNVQAILSITKHESNYINSVLNELYESKLKKTGLWKTSLGGDDRHYLEGFLCAVKLRYEEPNKYTDYTEKWNKIIDALNGIARECENFGAPATHDKLNKLININTIVENFR